MKSKILWVVVTLVLGALGSGLWELAFKPVLSWLATLGLDIVTLGLDSLRNGLYEEAAKGQYERVGIALVSALAGTLAAITTIVLLVPRRQRIRHATEAIDQSRRRLFDALPLLFLTTLALLLFQRICYINRAVNYFQQLATIAAPYLSEQERLLVHSKFSQVATREQYLVVISNLQSVGREHGAVVPEFTVY